MSNIYSEEFVRQEHAGTSTMFRTSRENRRAMNHSITIYTDPLWC